MTDDIYVVQAVTTGPDGYPYDEIIEIGVCRTNLDALECEVVYSNMVSIEPKTLGKAKLDYVSDNFRITPEMISAGEPRDKVASEVLNIIRGKRITCYDEKQEFGRYMACAPWDITCMAEIMPSISAKMPISLRCKSPEDEPQIIYKAYHRLCKENPASVGRGRRATDLAKMSAYLLFHMHGKGKYKL